MLPPIPALDDYGLSPALGFLPQTLPLARLPDPYYNSWEAVAANLQAHVLSRRLRGVVDRLPVLSTAGLESDAEWRRAYSLLCFVAHAYIWAGDEPADRLPPPVAVPLVAVAARLEVPPVATYAAVCLWNFKPLFLDEPVGSLDNLATLITFTGSIDESWFYLVSVAIEARGAPILGFVLAAMAAARRADSPAVARGLRAFAERLADLTATLQRMHESCDPVIFYHRIRPFLAGSKNMAEAGLPRGVVYDLGDGADHAYRQYAGGSNAQSSLIQFFDIALGIRHRPTCDSASGPNAGPDADRAGPDRSPDRAGPDRSPDRAAPDRARAGHNFIQEMRRYMPGPHARFLDDVARVANLRDYVDARRHDRELSLAYDACLAMLSAFRDKHIAIVTRYIINPSRRARARSRSRSREPVARKRLNLATAAAKNHKGTGGTALIPFLKQARDETGEPAVDEWIRRFMRCKSGPDTRSDLLFAKPEPPAPVDKENVDVKGLAWSWTMDDDVGGICLI